MPDAANTRWDIPYFYELDRFALHAGYDTQSGTEHVESNQERLCRRFVVSADAKACRAHVLS